MKNSKISRLFSVLLAVSMLVTLCVTPAVAVSVWDGSSASESLSGAGTAADPYLIKTANDLKFFADSVNGGTDYSGKVVYLQADIDLDGQAFTPIGSAARYFRGQFDGKNHTVSGVNITTDHGNGTGFFGGLHNGWVKNLHVEGSIINTYNSGACNIGGIVGTTSGAVTIFNCSFDGLIRSANTNVNCFFLAGGIVGGVNATTTGGAKIDYCYSSGVIDAYGNAGGLVGAMANSTDNKLVITNSYSDAVVTGSSAGTSTFDSAGTAAGLLGVMQNGTITMTNCFFAGRAPYKRSSGFGGPVINNKAGGTLTLTRVYYDNEKNLLNGGTFAAAVDGTGQTTDFMAYSLWGYFPNTYIAGTAAVKHPRFRLAEMGKGSKDEPFVVDSASDLKLISEICGTNNTYNFRDDFIVFGADINLNNAAFTPIGSVNMFFRGNVDGKGHTVSNLNVTKSTTIGVGFFGAAGGTIIKNLNVAGTVTNNTSTGAVAGFVAKTSDTLYLTNCHFDGTVYASNNLVSNGSGGYSVNEQNNLSAGGLVCEAGGHVTIDRCSVSGTVDGFGRAGGLVSSLNGAYTVTVKNSYCDATVTGKGPVDSSLSNLYTAGGLIGFLNSGTMTLTNCFFAGTAPAARSNGMAGPIINHNAGGTFNCTRVYYLSDTAIETYGENKDAAWFASAAAATALGAHFAEGDPHPVFASPNLSGSGSEDDPYLITCADDFQDINAFVRGGYRLEDNYFKLTTDLVLNEDYEDYEDWGTSAPTNNWLPVGTNASQFAGSLDGAGHTIYGLYASYPESTTGTGFFGGTYRGTIQDLHIKNAYVSGLNPVGGMAGFAQETTYFNCSFEGIVASTNENNYSGATGGLIGNAGMGNKLERCMTAGTVDAYSRSAGLIGSATATGKNWVYDCYSTMDVTGLGTQEAPGAGTAGLVGLVQNGTLVIEDSFFAGTYPNGSALRGPIAGHVASTVEDENCWYLADEADGLYGDLCDEDEITDGTVLDLLQGTRAETVWIQGEMTPVFAIKGDVNFDAVLDLADAMLILRHIQSVEALASNAASLADTDANGEITLTDYSAVKVKVLNAIKAQEEPIVSSVWSNFG